MFPRTYKLSVWEPAGSHGSSWMTICLESSNPWFDRYNYAVSYCYDEENRKDQYTSALNQLFYLLFVNQASRFPSRNVNLSFPKHKPMKLPESSVSKLIQRFTLNVLASEERCFDNIAKAVKGRQVLSFDVTNCILPNEDFPPQYRLRFRWRSYIKNILD